MTTLSRRRFLSLLALAGAGVACRSGGPIAGEPTATPSAGTLDAIRAGRDETLQLAGPFYEFLPDRDEYISVALLTKAAEPQPVAGADARVWFAKQRTSEALGPFDLRRLEDGFNERGLYGAHVTLPDDGIWFTLVEAELPDGTTQTGVGQAQVGARPDGMPKPDEKPPIIETPTVKSRRGVDPICTRDPQCAMHAISLDEAVANDKPTVLIIGTPKFCQSQFCGPEVDLLEEISFDTPQANFIHAEVLRDDEQETIQAYLGQRPEGYEGSPLAPIMNTWKVLEEPVTYFMGPDGTIEERLLGAVDGVELERATRALVG